MVGQVTTPAPATLRITDGRQGQAEAPMVKSKAFQLIVEEARAALDVGTSMYLLLISLFIFIVAYVYVFHYRIIPCEWYICSSIIRFGGYLIFCVTRAQQAVCRSSKGVGLST